MYECVCVYAEAYTNLLSEFSNVIAVIEKFIFVAICDVNLFIDDNCCIIEMYVHAVE